jgi:hypothetical protein
VLDVSFDKKIDGIGHAQLHRDLHLDRNVESCHCLSRRPDRPDRPLLKLGTCSRPQKKFTRESCNGGASIARKGLSGSMPLGKRPDCGDAKYAGVEAEFSCDIVDALQVIRYVSVNLLFFSYSLAVDVIFNLRFSRRGDPLLVSSFVSHKNKNSCTALHSWFTWSRAASVGTSKHLSAGRGSPEIRTRTVLRVRAAPMRSLVGFYPSNLWPSHAPSRDTLPLCSLSICLRPLPKWEETAAGTLILSSRPLMTRVPCNHTHI